MSNDESELKQVSSRSDILDDRVFADSRVRIVPILVTLGTVALAALLGWFTWDAYIGAPWTRDGTVRADVVAMAPEVSGRIVDLPVADNQFVHKGDLLMVIDPSDYEIAVSLAEAALEQVKADAEHKGDAGVAGAGAAYQQAVANLKWAKLNLERTRVRSPVDGYVTNLLVRLGSYATVGQQTISVVDAGSFWVDGYFEETNLGSIHDGDPATIRLLSSRDVIRGHVDSIARGIDVLNARPGRTGLASVNPIFAWARLAQRVPVRIHIDQVPKRVRLIAGMTATVRIDPKPRPASG